MDESGEHDGELLDAFMAILQHVELIKSATFSLRQRTQAVALSQREKKPLLSEIDHIEGWLRGHLEIPVE
jgi:hypothetical protein